LVKIESRADQDRSDHVLKNTHEDLSRNDISSIRKFIKILLKGGEGLDEVPGADQATASGMTQQMVAILEGLEKSEF
jgi:hypothetical protein